MIVVASTIPAYVCDRADTSQSWLANAEAMVADWPDGVEFFAALETDGRGPAPFAPLLDRLHEVVGLYWSFTLDDGAESITTPNRLKRITMGQTLAQTYAIDRLATHLLFVGADVSVPGDSISKLMEMDWPVVGGYVPAYHREGPRVGSFDYPVYAHMATTSFVMIRRDLLKQIHFRYDEELGMTDDPCLQADAMAHGWPTLVRRDLVGIHHPESIPPIEHRGHDLMIHR